jgi:hypothetical protein
MPKYVHIKVKVKKLSDKTLKKGDYVEFENKTYKFDGWDFGTYPMVIDLETNEQIQLPHY